MQRILIATSNQGKLRDFAGAAAPHGIEIALLANYASLPEVNEDGDTFEANARKKAEHYSRYAAGEIVLADDSGLEVDALGGAPGVESARYGGVETPYEEKFALIYSALRHNGGVDSTARFVCALALASGQCGADLSDARRILFETRASVEGRIAAAPRGRGGFGYDPIFFYPPYGCTLAEATPDQKAAVSHRGQAFRTLRRFLEVSASEQPASHARDVR